MDNCVERGITSCVCNGVLGYTFFLTPEDLRKHFGRTERKRRNLDLVRKSTLVYYLNRKFPNLLTNDINIIGNKRHPTEKPIELLKFYIQNSTKQGDIVLDPFAGCGSTKDAAMELGRNFVGFEIDPRYTT